MPMEIVRQLPYNHPYRWDGTLFGGPRLWRPNELTGSLSLWLDAEDTASITLNGATVSQWSDKSGNGRNAVQATAANQPTYNVTGINSKPALTFDGINDLLKTTLSVGISGANPRTLLYVYFDPGTSRGPMIQMGSSNSMQAFGRDISAGGLLYHWSIDLPMAPPSAGTSNIEVLQSTGAVSTGFLNGTQTAQGNFALNTTNNPISIGGRNSPEFSFAVYAAVNFGEIILTASVLSTDVRQRLEGYLAWKWGLEANLPSGHPYKLLPPTV